MALVSSIGASDYGLTTLRTSSTTSETTSVPLMYFVSPLDWKKIKLTPPLPRERTRNCQEAKSSFVRFVVNKISQRRLLRIRDFYFLWGRQRLNWGHFSCVGGNEKPEGEGIAITPRYAVMLLFEIDVFEDFTCLRRKITSLLVKLGGWHLYTWDFGWHVFRRFRFPVSSEDSSNYLTRNATWR